MITWARRSHDVTADGQRFLFSVDFVVLDGAASLTALSNWMSVLKK